MRDLFISNSIATEDYIRFSDRDLFDSAMRGIRTSTSLQGQNEKRTSLDTDFIEHTCMPSVYYTILRSIA